MEINWEVGGVITHRDGEEYHITAVDKDNIYISWVDEEANSMNQNYVYDKVRADKFVRELTWHHDPQHKKPTVIIYG